MIKVKELVPSVYFDKSRDFQFIAHLYEMVFNYIKTNTDSIYELPFSKNSDKELIDLVAYTLGFKPRHKYNTEQLVNICYILSILLKNKGNKRSLEWTVRNLYKIEGLLFDEDQEEIVVESTENIRTISGMYIPVRAVSLYVGKLQNIALLQDILDYILPAGTLYKIVRFELKIGEKVSETYTNDGRLIVRTRFNSQAVSEATSLYSTTLGTIDNSWVAKAEPLNIKRDDIIDLEEE